MKIVKKDVFNAIVGVVHAFLCKRNGICECYRYDTLNNVFNRHKIESPGLNNRLIFLPVAADTIKDVDENTLSVWITEYDNYFLISVRNKKYISYLISFAISFKGEIVSVDLNSSDSGRILEKLVPMFTDKMHALRYPE